MQTLIDLLSFKIFISPYVLFIFYYLGALGIPLASWLLIRWLRHRYHLFDEGLEQGKRAVKRFSGKYHPALILLFVLVFVFMEIMWRMMFEFMLAYLQIRDALVLGP